VPILLRVVT